MADVIIEVFDESSNTTIPVKYHDNGDGTYSEVVSVAGGGGNIDASQITSGRIAQARLGSGSGGAGTKFLADDQTYKTPAGGGITVVEDFVAGSDLTAEHVVSGLDLNTDGAYNIDIIFPYKSGWKASIALNSQGYTDAKVVGTRTDAGSSPVSIPVAQYYVIYSDYSSGHTRLRLAAAPGIGAFATFTKATQSGHADSGAIYFDSQNSTSGGTPANVTQIRFGLNSGNMIPAGTRILITKAK